jgi:hypothetical protein
MSSPRILMALLVAAISVSGCSRLGIGGGKEKSRTPVIGQRIPVPCGIAAASNRE